jgi:hypothetical protein
MNSGKGHRPSRNVFDISSDSDTEDCNFNEDLDLHEEQSPSGSSDISRFGFDGEGIRDNKSVPVSSVNLPHAPQDLYSPSMQDMDEQSKDEKKSEPESVVKPPRAPQVTDTPNSQMRKNLLPIARNLDTGRGDEGCAGEPHQPFVNRLGDILPPGDILMDMGSSTGCFLFEMFKLRPDMGFHGVEADLVRHKMAQSLHVGLQTKLLHQDILQMDSIDPEVTSIFAHDTVWPENVVNASTLLALSSHNLRTFICVKPRPELVASGKFVLSELIPFTLRGGNTQRVASVYNATTVLTTVQLRQMVSDHARHFFSRDRDFYVGETEAEKRKDLEVRPSDCRLLTKLYNF